MSSSATRITMCFGGGEPSRKYYYHEEYIPTRKAHHHHHHSSTPRASYHSHHTHHSPRVSTVSYRHSTPVLYERTSTVNQSGDCSKTQKSIGIRGG
ncbi:hypothetical protein F4815DRAFT_483429 [Daldinia loculata]|nr:hypothetical protein F4815DRAFT_483429 [Daldinia loculata]